MSKPLRPDEKPTEKEIDIVTDEDWKERVRRENEQLEAEARARQSGSGASPSEETRTASPHAAASSAGESVPLPPPSFPLIVSMLSTQAMVGLGLFSDPREEGSGPHLDLARHFIDLLAILEEKTRGNLSASESRQLTASLHELRLAFVEVSRQQAGHPGTEPQSS